MTAEDGEAGQRLDQWLWFARFVKSRTLGQALIERGKVRVNAIKVDKASHWLKAGDAITLSLGPNIRIVKVLGFGKRRGPASEAAGLFQELTPRADKTTSERNVVGSEALGLGQPLPQAAFHQPISGRPNKRERRVIVRVKGRER